MPPLHDWESFYVIIGSSAAALTGLQFVVMALAAEATHLKSTEETLSAFSTPTVVHFSAVLLISAIAATPHQTTASLATCLVLGGIIAIAYQIDVIRHTHRQTGYTPVLEDWLFHAIFPMVAYILLLIAGIAEYRRPAGPLYIVAISALILLFVGIHNAWDTAVFITSARRREGGDAERPPD